MFRWREEATAGLPLSPLPDPVSSPEDGDSTADEEACSAQWPGSVPFVCTKPIGHDGDHVATRNEGVAIVSWPGDSTADVLAEIADERERQDAKWGEQSHPDGTGHKKFAAMRDAARAACERAAAHGSVTENGYVTWRHILREEFYEALAETDPKALRAELIQVAAVATAWVEAIDRRSSRLALTDGEASDA
jgi:hypothetical protein